MAPRDLALSRPSPRGKKNSRGALCLRQIERGNSSLTQVRHDVIELLHTVTDGRAPEDTGKSPASKRNDCNTEGEPAIPRTRAVVVKLDFHHARG